MKNNQSFKIDDYIQYYDSSDKRNMFAWVDKMNETFDFAMLQYDDQYGGNRGTSCKIDEILNISPNKPRPLPYFKN